MGQRKFFYVGFHHIDLSWKRDRDENAEMQEVFIIRLLDALDTYPDFKFVIEQASHFRTMIKSRPDLVEKLKPFLLSGRIEFVGGLASTLETNVPCGESFIRNQAIGLKWVREHFGVPVKTGWLMDTFGVHAQVPQILKQFGISHLMANRFGGRKQHDVFLSRGLDGSEVLVVGHDVYSVSVRPGNTAFEFYRDWDGIQRSFDKADMLPGDGPFLVGPHTENEGMLSLRAVKLVKERQKKRPDETWGFATPSEYFQMLETTGRKWPVENGDLNPEFTGTFSLRTAIRLTNRRVENLLLEAEKWAALTHLSGWEAAIENAWWDMTYIHFHDVFTGSHPTHVFQYVMSLFSKTEEMALDLLHQAFSLVMKDKSVHEGAMSYSSSVRSNNTLENKRELSNLSLDNIRESSNLSLDNVRELSNQSFEKIRESSDLSLDDVKESFPVEGTTSEHGIVLTAFNGLPWHRRDIIHVALPSDVFAVTRVSDGENDVPFHMLGNELSMLADMPATGMRQFLVEQSPLMTLGGGSEAAMAEEKNGSTAQVDNDWSFPCIGKQDNPSGIKEVALAAIENEWVRLEFDKEHGLKKMIWKETGETLMENAGDLLVTQQDDGNFQIELPVASEVPAGAGKIRILQCYSSALGEHVVLCGEFPPMAWAGEGSYLRWQMAFHLYHGVPRIDLRLKLDWKGESTRIRLKLSSELDTAAGIFEVPFGTVRRKPYGVTGTARGEWPAQRFVTMEDGNHGIALINTGTVGVEVNGGTLLNTLIRAPKSEYAGMISDDSSSQHGLHSFNFAIVPYQGRWVDAPVVEMAQAVNNPVMTIQSERLPMKSAEIQNKRGKWTGQAGYSFLELSPCNVVLSSIKPVEGDPETCAIRVYETAGAETTASLRISGLQKVWNSDLQEQKGTEVTCDGECLVFDLKPFEIRTYIVLRT